MAGLKAEVTFLPGKRSIEWSLITFHIGLCGFACEWLQPCRDSCWIHYRMWLCSTYLNWFHSGTLHHSSTVQYLFGSEINLLQKVPLKLLLPWRCTVTLSPDMENATAVWSLAMHQFRSSLFRWISDLVNYNVAPICFVYPMLAYSIAMQSVFVCNNYEPCSNDCQILLPWGTTNWNRIGAHFQTTTIS